MMIYAKGAEISYIILRMEEYEKFNEINVQPKSQKYETKQNIYKKYDRKKYDGKKEVQCYKCKKMGHYSNKCTEKSEIIRLIKYENL